MANALVGCTSADVLHQPVPLDGLDDGVTLQPDGTTYQEDATTRSGTPLIWCVWPTYADLDEITDWFERYDFENDGVVEVEASLHVREKGVEQIQWTRLRLILRGGNLYAGLVIGLNAYGHHVLTEFNLKKTGNEVVDRILQGSASAVTTAMSPWDVGPAEGLVAGEDSCTPPDVTDTLTAPR